MTMRILFVEDNHLQQGNYRDGCERRGWDAVFAVSVEEAGVRLEEGEYDVIVLDHRIVGGTGEDVLSLIRARGIGARVVAASSLREGVYAGCPKVRKGAVCRFLAGEDVQ